MTQKSSDPSPWIVHTTRDTFDDDVLRRSQETPVVLDFWAPWCAPCRLLGPLLEQLAADYQGKFVLVKADTDQNPEAAAQFNVQGIPAVYGIVDGEVVDFFTGALPQEQLRAWVDRLIAHSQLAEAKRLEDLSPAAAEAKYRALLDQSPREVAAAIGLARTLLSQDQEEACREVLEDLGRRGFLEPEAQKVKAELELRSMQGGDLDKRRAAAEANPDDLPAQLAFAEALAGEQKYEDALRTCLAIVHKTKQGVGDQARELMIEIFRVLPEDSELIPTYRRQLSMALY